MIIKVVLHSIDDWPFVVLELCEKKKENDICRCNLLCFSASHRLSIWGENEEEEKLENLEEALESFCDVSMRALKEQY